MTTRLVEKLPQQQPLVLQMADCALTLAGIWLDERDQSMQRAAEHLARMAADQLSTRNEVNPNDAAAADDYLFYDIALLAGCVRRAIETDHPTREHWTHAVRAIMRALRASAERRAAN